MLLCEDDALIRLDLADILSGLGTEVTETASGQETLDRLQEGQYDALLIDVGLPDISGEEVATRVRAQHPDMPIIFATGQAEVPSAAALGRCAVVQKPFGDRDLERAFASLGHSVTDGDGHSVLTERCPRARDMTRGEGCGTRTSCAAPAKPCRRP